MSFSVSMTSEPYPTPLAPKNQEAGEQRHAHDGDQPPAHRRHVQPVFDEPRAAGPVLSTKSPFVGRLIDARV